MTETVKINSPVSSKFGASVDIDGNYIIIGGFGRDAGDTGNAYIYDSSGNQLAELIPSDVAANDGFGVSVSIHGNYAFVGATHADIGVNTDAGAAYVFDGSGGWSGNMNEIAKLTASDGATGDLFGVRNSIHEGCLIVGALGRNSNQGAVYYFLNESGSWNEKKIQTASDGASGDRFGISVSRHGDYSVVGAQGKNSYQGAAYIYSPQLGALSGYVTDKDTGAPIRGALILVDKPKERPADYRVRTDENGYYEVSDLEPGTWVVICRKRGFVWKGGSTKAIKRARVEAGKTKTRNFRLKRSSTDANDELAASFENYPNPFNPETWIPYYLKNDADVTIRIYNSAGRMVRILTIGRQKAGIYLDRDEAAYWDGRNDAGQKVSSGIYFYQFKAGKTVKTRKMAILK